MCLLFWENLVSLSWVSKLLEPTTPKPPSPHHSTRSFNSNDSNTNTSFQHQISALIVDFYISTPRSIEHQHLDRLNINTSIDWSIWFGGNGTKQSISRTIHRRRLEASFQTFRRCHIHRAWWSSASSFERIRWWRNAQGGSGSQRVPEATSTPEEGIWTRNWTRFQGPRALLQSPAFWKNRAVEIKHQDIEESWAQNQEGKHWESRYSSVWNNQSFYSTSFYSTIPKSIIIQSSMESIHEEIYQVKL